LSPWTTPDERPVVRLGLMLELAVSLADRDAVAALAPELADLDRYAPMTEDSSDGRVLGAPRVLLEDCDRARRHYGAALEALAKVRHRPEVALTACSAPRPWSAPYRGGRF